MEGEMYKKALSRVNQVHEKAVAVLFQNFWGLKDFVVGEAISYEQEEAEVAF